MYGQPVATVNALSDLTGLTVQAANNVVKVLCDDRVLSELTGNKRNRIFALSNYIDVFK